MAKEQFHYIYRNGTLFCLVTLFCNIQLAALFSLKNLTVVRMSLFALTDRNFWRANPACLSLPIPQKQTPRHGKRRFWKVRGGHLSFAEPFWRAKSRVSPCLPSWMDLMFLFSLTGASQRNQTIGGCSKPGYAAKAALYSPPVRRSVSWPHNVQIQQERKISCRYLPDTEYYYRDASG